MPIRIPMLEDKLEWLRAPRGLLLKDLARELNTSAPNIAQWIHGTDTTPPNTVPVKYLLPSTDGRPTLCTVFDVPYTVFETDTMEEFKRLIDEFRESRIERHSAPWTRLLEQATAAPELQIIGDPTRGLLRSPWDDRETGDTSDLDMPSFSVGDRIMVRVTYPGRWHGLLLMEDPTRRWSCLWPSENSPDTWFENEFGFPRQTADAPKRFRKIPSPPGLHRVVGIVTKTDGLLNQLGDIYVYPIRTEQLDDLAAELSQIRGKDANACVVMTNWFYAGPSSA